MRSSGIDAVPSPCVGVCKIDATSGLCVGCLRTLDEIALWGGLPDRAKRAVWSELAGRGERLRAAATRAGAGPSPGGGDR